jgi:hypothetical protein
MYSKGFVTDREQAIALYEKYGIPYTVMKRSGEVRAEKPAGGIAFKNEVEEMLKSVGGDGLLDHVDICQSKDGWVFISSSYSAEISDMLKLRVETWGYSIEYSGCRPYMDVDAVVIRSLHPLT